MLFEGERALIFSPHPDDDVFGMGATMYMMAQKGIDVYSAYVTHGVREGDPERIKTRKSEAERACGIVGSKPIFLDVDYSLTSYEEMKDVYEKVNPDIVFINNRDMHPTHTRVFDLAKNVLKDKEVYLYEVWSPLKKPNVIVYFDEDIMEIKLKAMKCHESELKRRNFAEAFKALNIYRGILSEPFVRKYGAVGIGKGKYAEAFEKVVL
ncbi:MAG: PIG-L family deacetylase [Candidatus Diapherotrites archaeon]|nr:PIG-L family deacetylase [Candidatus Diapherotrites archaeon]